MKLNFKNTAKAKTIKVRIVPKNGGDIILPIDSDNPTLNLTNNILSMCLASEYIDLDCEGAINTTDCIEFSSEGYFDIYINNLETPILTSITADQIITLEHPVLEFIECGIIPCEGAIDTTDCIEFKGNTFDIYIDGILTLQNATYYDIVEHKWSKIIAEQCFPEIYCENAIDHTDCIEFSSDYLYDVYINDMSSPYASSLSVEQLLILNHTSINIYECSALTTEWVISEDIQQTLDNNVTYTGSKYLEGEEYTSFSVQPLKKLVMSSFKEPDMIQWQAFIDVANELTGVTDWVVDIENNSIVYTVPRDCINNTDCEYVWKVNPNSATAVIYYTAEQGLRAQCTDWYGSNYDLQKIEYSNDGNKASAYCKPGAGGAAVYRVLNPDYVENDDKKTFPLDVVAERIISNTESQDQGISLLAETYIEQVIKDSTVKDEYRDLRLSILEDLEINKSKK